MFEGICEALDRELEMLDNKLMGGKAPMSTQDLDMIDKIGHALKCLGTYEAMKEGDWRRSRSRYRDEDYRRY